MRGEVALALGLVVLGACDRPAPRLICHNANCVGPVDSDRDATLPALDASLALRENDRPLFDGVELDLFWHGPAGDCRFGHDFADLAPRAADAAERVAGHLESTDAATWDGEPFQLFLDLKELDARPDEAQRTGHATCALDVATAIVERGRDRGHDVEVVVSSKVPALLAAVRAEPRFTPGIRLAGDLGIPRPLGADTRPLGAYGRALGLAVMTYNADYMTQPQYQAVRALDLALAQWMNTTTIEALDAIERYGPVYVLTSELPLVRSWLDR